MKTNAFLFIIATLFFSMVSCNLEDNPTESIDVEGAKADIELANKALEDVLYALINSEGIENMDEIDFSVPFGLYTLAYSKDPTNQDANFGLGLTGMFMITQDEPVSNAYEVWQTYLESTTPFETPLNKKNNTELKIGFPTSLSFFSIPEKDLAKTIIGTHKMALDDAPKLSTIQLIFENNLIPKLDLALSALDLVDDNPQYTFMITPKMQGDLGADSLEIDLTEIYALEVGINVLKVAMDIAVAYNVDFTGYDSLGMLNAFTQGSTFLTVRNSGQSLADAKTSLLGAIDKLESGINFLRSETDDQNNDIIKLDPGGNDEADLDSILAHTDDARELLTSGLSFTGDWDGNEATPEEELTINMGEYFDTPVQDIKALFPPYTASVGRDTSDYDWFWFYDDTLISATVNIPVENFYYYNRSYSWNNSGYEDFYTNANLSIPEFDQAFEEIVAELKQMSGIQYIYVQLNWWGDYLTVGQHAINDLTLSWNYEYKMAQSASYYPRITWTANSFDQWILPDPTFGGVLPGMTDAEFKRIFGVTAEGWEKTLGF
jgi:hypothetical protein